MSKVRFVYKNGKEIELHEKQAKILEFIGKGSIHQEKKTWEKSKRKYTKKKKEIVDV